VSTILYQEMDRHMDPYENDNEPLVFIKDRGNEEAQAVFW
jgi:hypothetical protein